MLRPFALGLIALALAACDGTSPLERGPSVPGLFLVSENNPEKDGRNVCGEPQGGEHLLAAVPNPYYGRSAYESSEDDRIFRFINVPDGAQIEIVRASWQGRSALGAGTIVRVLTNGEGARALDWDLRDASGALVPSGFYRATVTFSGPPPEWAGVSGDRAIVDLYVIQREDVVTWVDPTGCL